MNWRNFLLLIFIIPSLAACGGGGGGGGGGGDDAKISMSSSPISTEWEYGSSTATYPRVNFTATGSTSDAVYVYWSSTGNKIENVSQAMSSDTMGYFYVIPKSNLAVGTHTGNLTINVCRDEKCTKHYPGSPATVSYTFTVLPTISFEPNPVIIYAKEGDFSKKTATFKVVKPTNITSYTAFTNVASDYLSWTAGNEPDTYIVTAKRGWPAGEYDVSLQFSTEKSRQDLPVKIIVSPATAAGSNLTTERKEINTTNTKQNNSSSSNENKNKVELSSLIFKN